MQFALCVTLARAAFNGNNFASARNSLELVVVRKRQCGVKRRRGWRRQWRRWTTPEGGGRECEVDGL